LIVTGEDKEQSLPKMILKKLPTPENVKPVDQLPVYHDHVILTEKIYERYYCPDIKGGLGVISFINGGGDLYLNGKKYTVDQQSLLVINRASTLSIDISEPRSRPVLLFFASRLQELIPKRQNYFKNPYTDSFESNDPVEFSILERLHRTDHTLIGLLKEVYHLSQSSASFYALKSDALARHLFDQLLLKWHVEAKSASNISAVKHSTRVETYKRLIAVKEWMELNYHSPNLTLEQLGEMASMNSQHFLRRFKQAFSVTPFQYLKQFRLEQAKNQLETTTESVTHICDSVGYESLSHFSWEFKKTYGRSPSAHRKRFTR